MERVGAIRPLLLPTGGSCRAMGASPYLGLLSRGGYGKRSNVGTVWRSGTSLCVQDDDRPGSRDRHPTGGDPELMRPGTSCRNSVASWSAVPGAPYASAVIGSGVHPPYWPNGKEVCERPARTAGTTPSLGPAANVVAIGVCSSRLPITDRHPLVPVMRRPYVRCHVRTSFRAAVAHS